MIYYILIVIVVIVSILAWLILECHRNPNYLIKWWNRHIESECNDQDKYSINGIPSYNDAWDCSNSAVTALHRLITINHDDILSEVIEVIDIEDYDKIPIKINGKWDKFADKFQVLKRIISLFPEVESLCISICKPGTLTIENRGLSRVVQRYNYGLIIPKNDIGLSIGGYNVKWEEKQGFVWDDTQSHSIWNHTTQPRIIISSEIYRNLSTLNSIGSNLIYYVLHRSNPNPNPTPNPNPNPNPNYNPNPNPNPNFNFNDNPNRNINTNYD